MSVHDLPLFVGFDTVEAWCGCEKSINNLLVSGAFTGALTQEVEESILFLLVDEF